MLARKVPVPTVKVGAATVTFSLSLPNRAMRLAQAAAKGFLSDVATLPPADAEARLDALHQLRAEVVQLFEGQAAISAQLAAAADALTGEVFEGSGPLVELAHLTRTQLDTARAFDPALDLAEADELTGRLRALVDRLTEDREAEAKRVRALDDMLRYATEAALALDGSDTTRILALHRVTPALSLALKDLPPAPDPELVRNLAREAITNRKRATNKARHDRQHAAQRELDQSAAAIWEDAH